MFSLRKNLIIESVLIIWISVLYCIGSGAYFLPISVSLLIAIGIPLILIYFFSRTYSFLFSKPKGLLLLFLAIMCIGLTITNAPNYGYFKVSIFSTYIIIFLFLDRLVVAKTDYFMKVNIYVGIAFLVIIILKFSDPLTYLQTMAKQESRLGQGINDGENLNPIWLARYMCFMIITAYFYIQPKNIYQSLFKYGYISVTSIYLIATASKGPILGLIIALLLCIYEKRNKMRFWMKGFLFGFLAILCFFIFDIGNNKFLDRRFSVKDNNAVDERILFLNEIFDSFSSSKLLTGAGTGNAGYIINREDLRGYPHNIIVEVLYENGIIALLILLFILYTGFRALRFKDLSRNFKFWLCLFIFYAVNSFVSGDLPSNQFLFLSFLCLQVYNPARRLVSSPKVKKINLSQATTIS